MATHYHCRHFAYELRGVLGNHVIKWTGTACTLWHFDFVEVAQRCVYRRKVLVDNFLSLRLVGFLDGFLDLRDRLLTRQYS